MHATDPDLPEELVALAAQHLRDVLRWTVEHAPDAPALVVHDDGCALARGLAEAYRRCLPQAEHLRFDAQATGPVRAACERRSAGDLVVLVQSTSFRLDAFRIRLELFARSIKVIEHPHLARMAGAQARTYVEALAYDRAYYRGVGRALAQRLDRAQRTVVHSAAGELVYPAGLEPAKLNVGDYRGLAHVGGQFPIGEVFTESRDLTAVHGRASVAFFGDTSFRVNRPAQPITLLVEGGRVREALDTTAEFEAVLAAIRADEGEVWLRELGFGLNRALTPQRVVDDIGTFERMCGVHLSLGAKHATYAKAEIQKRHARHHVDVFLALRDVTLDGESIHRDGAWTVEPAPL
jgi:aminopeptidase